MSIPEIKALTDYDTVNYKPSIEARELLASLYFACEKYIKERKYVVSLLQEFYEEGGDLGFNEMNHYDAVISIRLRTDEDINVFFSFEELLETFMHELCHCEISSHNRTFWRILRRMVRQYEREILIPMYKREITLREIAENNQILRNLITT